MPNSFKYLSDAFTFTDDVCEELFPDFISLYNYTVDIASVLVRDNPEQNKNAVVVYVGDDEGRTRVWIAAAYDEQQMKIAAFHSDEEGADKIRRCPKCGEEFIVEDAR